MDEHLDISQRFKMCTFEEYKELAQKAGKPHEVRKIILNNGIEVGYRTNKSFFVSPEAFRKATGKELSGFISKAPLVVTNTIR